MSTSSSFWARLREPRFRHALVATHFKRTIPFQIKAMRKKLEISQEELATRAGLTQGVVSRAENRNYGKLTFTTVLKIAAGLDVAFVGRFVPFSEFGKLLDPTWDGSIRLTREKVPTFEEENASRTETGLERDATAASAIARVGAHLIQELAEYLPEPNPATEAVITGETQRLGQQRKRPARGTERTGSAIEEEAA